jgi:hypothetical protein
MKVTLNLATPPGWHERYGLAAGTLGLVLGLAVLAALGHSAVSNFRHDRSVGQAYTQASAQLNHLQDKESSLGQDLAKPALHSLVSETAYLNGLIERKQFSVARLTARVSELLPPNVRLDAIAFSTVSTEPLIRLSVEAKDERAFEAFLSNLEGAADFSDVVVTSQGFADSSSNSNTVLATCTARYSGAGTVSEGQGMTDAEAAPQDNPPVH